MQRIVCVYKTNYSLRLSLVILVDRKFLDVRTSYLLRQCGYVLHKETTGLLQSRIYPYFPLYMRPPSAYYHAPHEKYHVNYAVILQCHENHWF